jgi:hypothetical protein
MSHVEWYLSEWQIAELLKASEIFESEYRISFWHPVPLYKDRKKISYLSKEKRFLCLRFSPLRETL